MIGVCVDDLIRIPEPVVVLVYLCQRKVVPEIKRTYLYLCPRMLFSFSLG